MNLTAEIKAIERLLGPQGTQQLIAKAQAQGLEGESMQHAFESLCRRLAAGASFARTGELDPVTRHLRYKTQPVSVREFVFSKFYLDKGDELYPEVLNELIELNSGKYDEAVLTGGIGSGKTTLALYSQAYQLYLLSCLRNPHALFGLDSSSEIKVVFQNIRESLARGVDYKRFRDMIEKSAYFKRHFMFREELLTKLIFPNRIEIEPVGGTETASIGQNVIGGIIDEINFMAVVENSKQAADGGTYDQAVELYNTIARRRKSRFMKLGQMPGLLCLVSSKKTPGQFTDVKEAEAKHNPRIYVFNKRVWDIKPTAFCGQKFRVFVGDESRKSRIIEAGEVIPIKDAGLIDEIPIEFLQEFKDDITKALRDIAGRSTLAIHPFMPEAEKVNACFGKRKSVIEQEKVDFVLTRPLIYKSRITDTQFKRFAHIDLALTGDSAGLVIGHVPEFVTVQKQETYEKLPVVAIDCALEIEAPTNGEIEFANIRRILYKLREFGMPITWVSLDSFQSADTMQILRAEGFTTGYQSMDTTMVPYQMTKAALYEGRVRLPEHAKLKRELLTLERDFKKGKVDHNPHGSKDIADALAGVVYGLTMRREVWSSHGVPPVVAPSVYQVMMEQKNDKLKKKLD